LVKCFRRKKRKNSNPKTENEPENQHQNLQEQQAYQHSHGLYNTIKTKNKITKRLGWLGHLFLSFSLHVSQFFHFFSKNNNS